VRQESLWLLESGLTTLEPLESHIEKLVCFLEEKTELFSNLLSSCSVIIICGFSSENGQGGFTLTSKLLSRIAVLSVDLSVYLYPKSSTGEYKDPIK
jgi:Domain of unknown function (DUF4279)